MIIILGLNIGGLHPQECYPESSKGNREVAFKNINYEGFTKGSNILVAPWIKNVTYCKILIFSKDLRWVSK